MRDGIILEYLRSGDDGAVVVGVIESVRLAISAIGVRLPRDPSQDTASQRLCRRVQRLEKANLTDDQYNVVSNKLLEQILRAGHSLILHLNAEVRARPVGHRLADHLFAPITHLEMVDGGKHGFLMTTDRVSKYFDSNIPHAYPGAHDLRFEIDQTLPNVHIDDVHVIEVLSRDPLVEHVVCKVFVNGAILFCKAERGGIAFGDSVVGRDFQTMLQIYKAFGGGGSVPANAANNGDDDIRVPGLRGFIRHPTENHVVGFLREWVEGASLDVYDTTNLPQAVRAEWDNKTAGTVSELHEAEAYWGAADSKSVIIDTCGEPWVIDFGAKVNRGLRREAGDMEAGDWSDYEAVHGQIQPQEATVTDDEWSDSDGSLGEDVD